MPIALHPSRRRAGDHKGRPYTAGERAPQGERNLRIADTSENVPEGGNNRETFLPRMNADFHGYRLAAMTSGSVVSPKGANHA